MASPDGKLPHHYDRPNATRKSKTVDRSAVGVCTKYTLFFENFIMVSIGLAMTGVGTYLLAVKEKRVHDVFDFFLDPSCDICLAGCIILFMGFIGCVGALREVVCCLKIYYFALCVILLGELVIAVLMFVSYYVPDTKDAIFPSDTFKKAIINYRDDPDMQTLIDNMQRDLGCCGLADSTQGFLDWNDNIYFNCSKTNRSPESCSVPHSCCRQLTENKINYRCGANVLSIKDGVVSANNTNVYRIYQQGCMNALGDWINSHALIVGGVMLGILLPQIFVVVLTRNLIDMIKAQKHKW